MNIDLIIGTRPEAIKLAPVIAALRELPHANIRVIFTGQHRELMSGIDEAFDLRPDVELHIMRPTDTLSALTARLLTELHTCFLSRPNRPDAVIVQGDTTSAFAGALAAFYLQIPVGHVEAGLRTDDRFSPFPEEFNRRGIAQLATWHFAPTQRAFDRLKQEGHSHIHLTGNTVIDAILKVCETLGLEPSAGQAQNKKLRKVLVTAHRRESLDGGLGNICNALRELVARFDDIEIQFPMHMNPDVRQVIEGALSGVERVRLSAPLTYREMLTALTESHLLLTDSGGLQEEAPTFRLPVLVLRDKTERMEAIEAGVAILCGTDTDAIVREATRLLSDPQAHAAMQSVNNPFGDGKAAERIAQILANALSSTH